jgi:hypothetical protein
MVRSVLLWKFGFYCVCYVCNAHVERNLQHFIVYLITYANLCCVCSTRCSSVMAGGAWSATKIEQGFFSGFPRMQCDMFVIFCNTIPSSCNFDSYLYIIIYIYIYIYICVCVCVCGPYIQTVLVWSFMPKNQNFNHSVWLILYSNSLDLQCVKWIESTLCCDYYTKIN